MTIRTSEVDTLSHHGGFCDEQGQGLLRAAKASRIIGRSSYQALLAGLDKTRLFTMILCLARVSGLAFSGSGDGCEFSSGV